MNETNAQLTAPAKPPEVASLATITLVSGIVNVILAVTGLVFLVITIDRASAIPLLLLPVIPGLISYLELRFASGLLALPHRELKPIQLELKAGSRPFALPSDLIRQLRILAALEVAGMFYLNFVAAGIGIAALVLLSTPQVQQYFHAVSRALGERQR
ncbi:MAG: hypothetical protein RMM31_10925 [Anaerolineae bacterium]|nr:hypothetical protein [Thermoflexales bacterium]MDW8396742.1 hypothetical protein [Anaerolineae bacterium]